MKVLIVNPPYSLEERYGKRLKHFGGYAEPLGPAYVAAALREAGCRVEFLDAPVLGLKPEEVARHAHQGGFDLVGINVLTPSYRRALDTARAVKTLAPRAKLVMGGPHATVLPAATLGEFAADAVVFGEGEHTMVELARAFAGGRDLAGIPGVAFAADGQPVVNPKRPQERELDRLPKPARDLMPMDRYFLTATRVQKGGFCGTVIVGRGCPHGCAFCSHTFGRTSRFHSPARVLEEIEELTGRYHATQINMEADTLTTNRTYVHALCRELIAAGVPRKVRWTCESRADGLDLDTLRIMREAGCWQVSVGVESGSERLLKTIRKGETRDQIERAVGLCHQAGLSVRGFYMLGLPGESTLR